MENRQWTEANLWLASGPGVQAEFMAEPDGERLAETMVAFANTDGGTILVGVTEDGQVSGYFVEEELEGALRQALTSTRPPIRTEWEQLQTPGGTIFVVRVPRSSELHSLYDGRVLIRAGVENRPLGGDAIRQLAATKSSGDFEMEPVTGASFQDLDQDVIAEYIEKRAEKLRHTIAVEPERLLQQIGALTAEGVPTVAGLLLFGREPQLFLHQAGVVFVRFNGTELRRPDGLPGYARREEIGGPLAQMIERTWQVIWSEMRIEAVMRGLKREERPEYPMLAVREALVNAVAHRDYRLGGRRIEVRMFDDRLEISSPGGLPGFITVDNIVDEHFSRNPRIVNGLFMWGYIEELGLGIDLMIQEMLTAGHPQPEFKATPYSFTVTLRHAQQHSLMPEWETSMNERQMRALQYLQTHDRITNREYRRLCPDVSSETLRLDLADLVDKGLLLKVGEKKGTYYILRHKPG
ncbi:MAG TPA: transcriptional regulator [Anaerolineae bacterium]|nr:transcriptional regulator [Anaerolineae bacterium]